MSFKVFWTSRDVSSLSPSRTFGTWPKSSGPRIAGGKGYLKQAEEIKRLNEKIDGIRILRSGEVSILPDGNLAAPDEVLARLDYVIASVHRNLDLPREQMTKRIISALEHPLVKVLAHPTSRRVLPVSIDIESGPIDVDLDAVFQTAAARNTFLEINSMPSRLDLNDALARRARENWNERMGKV